MPALSATQSADEAAYAVCNLPLLNLKLTIPVPTTLTVTGLDLGYWPGFRPTLQAQFKRTIYSIKGEPTHFGVNAD